MPQRTYKIGEVAGLTGLKPFVLRFWETEFPQLTPVRTQKGQRLYTDEHLELIGRIKTLLYEEKLTIDGARRRLADDGRDGPILRQIYDELTAIRRLLDV
ncbi:transcriptional regulator, MerR family [Solidesulfovibrio fructosivorans JJ]]|uniref:Transcriptional regulator, MerR family n=1 Tax=Solidesulfovibrio fructosivorans JJ] TaxID=596151 RepID=E1K0Q6_SOLFR|nr:MerR family transcriptional regulator [Solidesulfovibrio fructosivorans]EFL49820.1 transcriptional regulator, MerR family [Solidesulfovibrio fructosivorans JJ]]